MAAVNVLIAFYSRNGSTETLANGIAEGARSEGAEVRLRRAREIVSEQIMTKAPGWLENAKRMNQQYEAPTEADAEWADAIIFGTPTRFGNISSDLKSYVDSLGGLWFQGKLVGKAGSAFTSSSTQHGGNESTIVTMYNFMAHLGLIVVPLGYADPSLYWYSLRRILGLRTRQCAPNNSRSTCRTISGEASCGCGKGFERCGRDQDKVSVVRQGLLSSGTSSFCPQSSC